MMFILLLNNFTLRNRTMVKMKDTSKCLIQQLVRLGEKCESQKLAEVVAVYMELVAEAEAGGQQHESLKLSEVETIRQNFIAMDGADSQELWEQLVADLELKPMDGAGTQQDQVNYAEHYPFLAALLTEPTDVIDQKVSVKNMKNIPKLDYSQVNASVKRKSPDTPNDDSATKRPVQQNPQHVNYAERYPFLAAYLTEPTDVVDQKIRQLNEREKLYSQHKRLVLERKQQLMNAQQSICNLQSPASVLQRSTSMPEPQLPPRYSSVLQHPTAASASLQSSSQQSPGQRQQSHLPSQPDPNRIFTTPADLDLLQLDLSFPISSEKIRQLNERQKLYNQHKQLVLEQKQQPMNAQQAICNLQSPASVLQKSTSMPEPQLPPGYSSVLQCPTAASAPLQSLSQQSPGQRQQLHLPSQPGPNQSWVQQRANQNPMLNAQLSQKSISMHEPQLPPRYSNVRQFSTASPQSPFQLPPGQWQQSSFSPMSQQGYSNNYPQPCLSPCLPSQPSSNQAWIQQRTNQNPNLQQQNSMLNAQLSQQQATYLMSRVQFCQIVAQSMPSPGSRNSPYSNPPDFPFHPHGAALYQQQSQTLPQQLAPVSQ